MQDAGRRRDAEGLTAAPPDRRPGCREQMPGGESARRRFAPHRGRDSANTATNSVVGIAAVANRRPAPTAAGAVWYPPRAWA
jgi:hypothetical protein